MKEATEGNSVEGGILKIFPDSWQMAELLSSEFCRMTREHLDAIMASESSQTDIAEVIKTMHKTIEFE